MTRFSATSSNHTATLVKRCRTQHPTRTPTLETRRMKKRPRPRPSRPGRKAALVRGLATRVGNRPGSKCLYCMCQAPRGETLCAVHRGIVAEIT